MRSPPLEVVVQWPTPNYDDPVTHGPSLLITNIIFITLVMVAFVGRIYSRIFIRGWLGVDDALCVLALVSQLLGRCSIRVII